MTILLGIGTVLTRDTFRRTSQPAGMFCVTKFMTSSDNTVPPLRLSSATAFLIPHSVPLTLVYFWTSVRAVPIVSSSIIASVLFNTLSNSIFLGWVCAYIVPRNYDLLNSKTLLGHNTGVHKHKHGHYHAKRVLPQRRAYAHDDGEK